MKWWLWSFYVLVGGQAAFADVEILTYYHHKYPYSDDKVICTAEQDHLSITLGDVDSDGENTPLLIVEVDGLEAIKKGLEKDRMASLRVRQPSDTQYVEYWLHGVLHTIQPKRASGLPACDVYFRKSRSQPDKALDVFLECIKLLPEDPTVHPQSGRSFSIRPYKAVPCLIG